MVAWEGDTILYAGPRSGWEGQVDQEYEGCTVIPGFVDCHTHLPFVGWREEEFEARLGGTTYRDQAGEGGIGRSARMLAEASDDQVLEFCRPLLAEMLAHGTTALEFKTGYGLSVEAELRQARLARRLADESPQTAVVTLLACHAVPPGVERQAWVDAVCQELIPRAAAEGLADAVDVYVEDIAFTVPDLERVASATGEAGLPLRVHADQLGPTGATEAAARLGARSADHLNHSSPEAADALAAGETVGVLLPASTFLLGAAVPPIDRLRWADTPLAVATDFNPGTSPVLSMPEAVALVCAWYRLAPLQTLLAATANAAWVLGLHEALGSLAPGRRADLVVLDGPDFRRVPYRPGHNPVVEVVVGGERLPARTGHPWQDEPTSRRSGGRSIV
ncbi:MAG TPA: imidazolonepropionase [Propionibacteriaceae bacterium]|nr:imidazolonepropionase [Propionibacteriaceae bacterium]